MILDDLRAEHESLDAVLEPLDDAAWDAPTPSPGWRVRDQVGHLAFFDRMGRDAATDPDAFVEARDQRFGDIEAFMAETEALGRELTGRTLLHAWRTERSAMIDALDAVPDGTRLPWYGPPMSVRSFVTARLMETWAHGQDVVDALHLPIDARPLTDRLAHVAFIGCATRGWSYTVRGMNAPDVPVRVELALPSGATFTNGDDNARDRVTGDVVDFALVVTQRRNVADTSLAIEGDAAREWMSIAQCFAGAPTSPPPPRA